jgi:hypothetical protein
MVAGDRASADVGAQRGLIGIPVSSDTKRRPLDLRLESHMFTVSLTNPVVAREGGPSTTFPRHASEVVDGRDKPGRGGVSRGLRDRV